VCVAPEMLVDMGTRAEVSGHPDFPIISPLNLSQGSGRGAKGRERERKGQVRSTVANSPR